MQIVLIFHRIVGKPHRQGTDAYRTVDFSLLVALEGEETLRSDLLLTEVPVVRPNTQVALETGARVPLQLQPMFFRIQVNPRSTPVG